MAWAKVQELAKMAVQQLQRGLEEEGDGLIQRVEPTPPKVEGHQLQQTPQKAELQRQQTLQVKLLLLLKR